MWLSSSGTELKFFTVCWSLRETFFFRSLWGSTMIYREPKMEMFNCTSSNVRYLVLPGGSRCSTPGSINVMVRVKLQSCACVHVCMHVCKEAEVAIWCLPQSLPTSHLCFLVVSLRTEPRTSHTRDKYSPTEL